MDAQGVHRVHRAHSHREAEIDRIQLVLRSFGVLTRPRLAEMCGARSWPDRYLFEAALDAAVQDGRVRRLGDKLYELPDDAR